MTCVIGLVYNNKVWMGADSASINATSLESDICLFPKIFKVKNFLIGYTTSWRMGQLLAHSLKLPPINNKDILKYMTTSFISAAIKCFEGGKWLGKENNQVSGGTFLVGINGRLFRIQDDFAVLESTYGFDAVGCGEQFAKGAMHASKIQDPSKKITAALEAAEAFSAGVQRPFHIKKI